MKIKYVVFSLLLLAAGILAACGGSSSSSGFSQTFTTSAGAGEVLQFSVDTTAMTYSYKVVQSSYGVTLGQTSTGSLFGKTAIGSYTVGASSDGFIQGGVVFPVQNGLLVGHVQISLIGGAAKIPVFGVSNPITTLPGLAGTYNYEGFGCGVKSGGNVLGAFGCLSHYGTIKVDPAGTTFTVCKGGNISAVTPACTTNSAGTIVATATPGVFDFVKTGTGHIGWFLAFTAPNGQKVAVIDHDDIYTPAFGHSVASSQVAMVSGAADGNYFTRNNWGMAGLLTVSGTNFTDVIAATSGTLALNTPWTGLATYTYNTPAAASGVAMIAGTGAFTDNSTSAPSLFGVGLRY